MADLDITQMTQLLVAPAADDAIYLGDVSEAVLDNQNKHIEVENLFQYLEGTYQGDIVLHSTGTLNLLAGAIHINEAVDLLATSTELNQLDGVAVGGAAAGDIVTIDATQTLTNKTLTTPTIGDLTNIAHTHADAANGGQLTSPLVNEAVALLSTATELNQLDGVTVGGSAAGDISTIDGTQTLTNKTLTTPTIGDFTNAGHDHSNAAGGGTISRTVELPPIEAIGVTPSTGDNQAHFMVDSILDGLDLTNVTISHYTRGTGGTTTVVIHRRRSESDVDMMTTGATLDSTEYVVADGTIDTTNDDVQTGDIIAVDVDAVQTGTPYGLFVTLEFS